jgi:hypothetical protein
MSNGHKVVVLARRTIRSWLVAALLVIMVAVAGRAQTVSQTAQGRVQDLLIIEHDWYKDFPSLAGDNGYRPEYEIVSPGRQNCCEEDCGTCSQDRTSYPCPRRNLAYSSYSVSSRPLGFIYRVRIRNAGVRSIAKVVWDYVFNDPLTDAELSRHTFSSDTKLSAGKTRLLIGHSPAPPTRVISVRMLYQWSTGSTYAERIEIKSIVFADGSVISY